MAAEILHGIEAGVFHPNPGWQCKDSVPERVLGLGFDQVTYAALARSGPVSMGGGLLGIRQGRGTFEKILVHAPLDERCRQRLRTGLVRRPRKYEQVRLPM